MGKVRFRHSVSLVVAGVMMLLGGLALATSRWYLAPVLLIPLGITAWALRSGTEVDTAGVRVRALLRSRYLTWPEIDGFVPQDGRVLATLTNGRAVALPAVSRADLPRLLAAGGQPSTLIPATRPPDSAESTEPAPPTEPDDDPDTDAPQSSASAARDQ